MTRHSPLCTRTAEIVCTEIKGTEISVRRVPGTALVNPVSNEVIYTPPETESRIRELLANWEQFLHAADPLHADTLDPLIRMSVAHYQFEAIHPFTDGNGRSGRVLNSLFLVEQGLLPMPILYLSRYIIAHKSDYYRLLLDITRKNDQSGWEQWLLFMLRGVEETAIWTAAKISAIRDLAEEAVELARKTLPKIYSRELMDVVFEQPYCRISNVVEAEIAGRQAASRYLKALVSIGMLHEQVFGREKLFVNVKLLDLLTRRRRWGRFALAVNEATPPAESNGGCYFHGHETRFELAFPSRSLTSHTRCSLIALSSPFRWQITTAIAQTPVSVHVLLILGPVLLGTDAR